MTRPTTPKGYREALKHPGAGTLYVHGVNDGGSTSRSRRISNNDPTWDELVELVQDPCRTESADGLLERGIEGYTFIPAYAGGCLGRGKFSCVYKVKGNDGRYYALKHTPLYIHHPLIAARLLREPTLLSQLPPHPNLVSVHGTIRTPGHFYLVEQYAAHHVPLSSHPLPLSPSRAAFILDQLVSVLRDCLHKRGRVVHRDLKGENVLVDVETGEIVLLDLGLATHYSASQPKLTTCCGSPAFHSPEIVRALNHPPGQVSYYGPELDIWCIALTLLSLLLQTQFPLGTSHKSTHIMRDRSIDRLQELDKAYPPSAPWRCVEAHVPASKREFETSEWKRVRNAVRDFLEINGEERMSHFDAYIIGPECTKRVAEFEAEVDFKAFKSTSFEPVDIRHTLPLYLQPSSGGPLRMSNPTGLSERKVFSYLKYILRSRGVLYHCLPNSTLQLVLPYPSQGPESPPPVEKETSWVSSLFAQKRSTSLPPKARSPRQSPSRKGDGKSHEKMQWVLKCYLKIECSDTANSSPTASPASGAFTDMLPPLSPIIDTTHVATLSSISRLSARPKAPSRAHSVEGIGRVSSSSQPGSRASSTHRPRKPHPLSRQVSRESTHTRRSGHSHHQHQHQHHHHPSVPHVTLTLSDPRGYGILRTCLDVKHEEGHTPPTPTIPVPTMIADAFDDDEDVNRGRPRSKEDPVLISVAPHVSISTVELTPCTEPLTVKTTPREPREPSRGRKGLLDGWFGLGVKESDARPVSSPPSIAKTSTTITTSTDTTLFHGRPHFGRGPPSFAPPTITPTMRYL